MYFFSCIIGALQNFSLLSSYPHAAKYQHYWYQVNLKIPSAPVAFR